MLSNGTFVAAAIGMSLVTFALRSAPTLMPKSFLHSPLLSALNRTLPLCVMVILLLFSLPFNGVAGSYWPLLAQVLALVLVLISYMRFANSLLSMVVGVASLNLLLHILPT